MARLYNARASQVGSQCSVLLVVVVQFAVELDCD